MIYRSLSLRIGIGLPHIRSRLRRRHADISALTSLFGPTFCRALVRDYLIKSSERQAGLIQAMVNEEDQQALRARITELEQHLNDAKHELKLQTLKAIGNQAAPSTPPSLSLSVVPSRRKVDLSAESDINPYHSLLLLADSALPLGSFAFSSGLESYLAHTRHHQSSSRASSAPGSLLSSFHTFLNLSISSVASTALPYVLAAHRSPQSILSLNDTYDASISCTVTRRASVAQGKALLTIWERALRPAIFLSPLNSPLASLDDDEGSAVSHALDALRDSVSSSSISSTATSSVHFPSLWGVVTRLMRLSLHQSAYIFLLNHVKAVVSAAVRASVMGPYQAQAVLAGAPVQDEIKAALEMYWDVPIEDAGQVVPVLDLWAGRHDLLYSRIFNS